MNALLMGKTIVRAHLAADKNSITFELSDGRTVTGDAYGDCCSSSWIESIDAPDALLGTVVAAEEIPMPDLGDLPNHDVMAYYGYKITTEKGSCVIDYRNDSNGYYGGWLQWS